MTLTPHIKNILKNSKKDTEWKKEAEERQAARKESKKAGLVATQLAYYMKVNNISQTKVGKLIGVTPQYISKVLKGRENLTLATIEEIEKKLCIEIITVNDLSNTEITSNKKHIINPTTHHLGIESLRTSHYFIKDTDYDASPTIKYRYYNSILKSEVKTTSDSTLGFPNDYFEQMKQKAIQRAHERFEKLKNEIDFQVDYINVLSLEETKSNKQFSESLNWIESDSLILEEN